MLTELCQRNLHVWEKGVGTPVEPIVYKCHLCGLTTDNPELFTIDLENIHINNLSVNNLHQDRTCIDTTSAPTCSSAPGIPGQVVMDDNYLYLYVQYRWLRFLLTREENW